MKRLLDLVFAITMLAAFSAVILIVSLLIRWKLGSPILFKQERIGYRESPFSIYKFRTMMGEVSEEGVLLREEERMTKLGSWLRRFSLDELPQLINVIKGEMSFIGPRPLLPEYLPYYSEKERMRHDVRPGITGLAQVEGRNNLPWDKRFELDVYYVKNQSLYLDFEIFTKTVGKVFQRNGIEEYPGQSMLDFDVERKMKQTRQ